MKALFVISQERFKREAADFCLSHLKKSDEVIAVYILDSGFSARVESFLCENTFVADKPSESVTQALREEYEQRAEVCLQRLKEEFTSHGISCKIYVKSGEYQFVLKDLVGEFSPDLVVVSEKKRSRLMRLLGRSEAKKFQKLLHGVEVQIF
jgi:nucleotide-binding universal stress UspA family protein